VDESIGPLVSPCGHRERTNSLSAATVVEGSYLLGPMSVPSNSRNFTSIGSFPPAISPGRIAALAILTPPRFYQDPPTNRDNSRGRGRESADEFLGEEKRLPGNPRRKGRKRCGSNEGSDLLRKSSELLRGKRSGGAETSVSRGRRERASGIRRRFDKYTLHELVIDCSRWRLLIRRGRRE
jgi:hypothetical protein